MSSTMGKALVVVKSVQSGEDERRMTGMILVESEMSAQIMLATQALTNSDPLGVYVVIVEIPQATNPHSLLAFCDKSIRKSHRTCVDVPLKVIIGRLETVASLKQQCRRSLAFRGVGKNPHFLWNEPRTLYMTTPNVTFNSEESRGSAACIT